MLQVCHYKENKQVQPNYKQEALKFSSVSEDQMLQMIGIQSLITLNGLKML